MAETMTLQQFAENLNNLVSSDENVAALTMPIDFQDVSSETLELVNTYETHLSNNDYTSAYEVRKDNPVLESLILDATKLNYLQTLMLTSYEFSKTEKTAKNTSYDNTTSGLEATNLQDAVDEISAEIGISEGSEGSLSDRVDALEDKTSEIDSNLPFKLGIDQNGNYGYYKAGADTVTPFKLGYEDTPATATSAQLAKGYTAWVNGKLITGTAITVNTDSGYVILSSSNINTGKELTGGWTPSGEFGVGTYGNETATVTSNNRIDLTNITSIQFNFSFGILASYKNAEYITDYPYFQCYLINTSGTKLKTQTIYAKNKTAGGSQIITINTSDLSGNYQIGYVCRSYWREEDRSRPDGSTYEVTYGAATNISRIALY